MHLKTLRYTITEHTYTRTLAITCCTQISAPHSLQSTLRGKKVGHKALLSLSLTYCVVRRCWFILEGENPSTVNTTSLLTSCFGHTDWLSFLLCSFELPSSAAVPVPMKTNVVLQGGIVVPHIVFSLLMLLYCVILYTEMQCWNSWCVFYVFFSLLYLWVLGWFCSLIVCVCHVNQNILTRHDIEHKDTCKI